MKKRIILPALTISIMGGFTLLFSEQSEAHGYIESPICRSYQGTLDNDLGMYGKVIYEPQSLEAKKGFPQAGPPDGHIASANGAVGDFVLDSTGSNRWKKQEMKTGPNNFKWNYTANHSTSKWHYYITKNGWNPEEPLKRDAFEKIGEIKHDKSSSENNKVHQIDIPTDHSGYHVILAVWDVYDTENAFYQVVDANLTSGGSITPPEEKDPETPKNLEASQVTTSTLKLTWNKADNAQEYNIYRDGKKVSTVSGNQFNETDLKEDTTYSYQVESVGKNGSTSEKSETLKVTTKSSETPDNQKPTAPTNLHSMGTTETSVDLMWNASTHFLGVKEYDVYRDGTKITTTDKTRFMDANLKSDTTYKYTVKAISIGGNVSDTSEEFTVKTKQKQEQETPNDTKVWKVGSFSNPILYTAGEKVAHNGKVYTVLTTHQNYGDSNWAPGIAQSLFS